MWPDLPVGHSGYTASSPEWLASWQAHHLTAEDWGKERRDAATRRSGAGQLSSLLILCKKDTSSPRSLVENINGKSANNIFPSGSHFREMKISQTQTWRNRRKHIKLLLMGWVKTCDCVLFMNWGKQYRGLFNVPGVGLRVQVTKTSIRDLCTEETQAKWQKQLHLVMVRCASVEMGNLPATYISFTPYSTPMLVSPKEHATYTKIDFLF